MGRDATDAGRPLLGPCRQPGCYQNVWAGTYCPAHREHHDPPPKEPPASARFPHRDGGLTRGKGRAG